MKKTDIRKIKPNPKNPRFIKDKKFNELVKSIKEFPEMLDTFPITVDEDMVILSGNMRYRACKALDFKTVPVEIVKGLTEDQKLQMVIKANTHAGSWDWDIVANEWDIEKLEEWGLEVPLNPDEIGVPENKDTDNIFATELDQDSQYLVLKFDRDIDFLQAKSILDINSVHSMRANGKPWSKGIGRVVDGVQAINKLKNGN